MKHLKQLFTVALLMVATVCMAQSKVAHIEVQKLISEMPEVIAAQKEISELEKSIKLETEKVTPLREKNIENLSKIQRLNLELQSLDEENTRTQDEIQKIKDSQILLSSTRI